MPRAVVSLLLAALCLGALGTGCVEEGADAALGDIRAFDKRTGELRWSADLPAAGFATPSVYTADATQYPVVAWRRRKARRPVGRRLRGPLRSRSREDAAGGSTRLGWSLGIRASPSFAGPVSSPFLQESSTSW